MKMTTGYNAYYGEKAEKNPALWNVINNMWATAQNYEIFQQNKSLLFEILNVFENNGPLTLRELAHEVQGGTLTLQYISAILTRLTYGGVVKRIHETATIDGVRAVYDHEKHEVTTVPAQLSICVKKFALVE